MSAMQNTQVVLPSPRKLFTPGVTTILALSVMGFLLTVWAPGPTVRLLGLSVDGVFRGMVWQFLTYPFLPDSVTGLLFRGLAVLFIGSLVEREWRTVSFLVLWLVVSVGCGILWVVISMLAGGSFIGQGAAGGVYGLIAVMGLLHRGQRFFVFFAAVEAQHLAIGLVVIGALLSLAAPMTLIWVAGAPIAWLYVKARWRLAARRPTGPVPSQQGGRGRFVELD